MKRQKNVTDTHHKKPRANGGTNDPQNLRLVKKSKHQAFHHLFYEGSPQKVANIINRWIDPNYRLVVVKSNQDEEFLGEGIA